MRNSKKIKRVALALALATFLTACGEDNPKGSGGSNERELWICAYDGGYGKEWINNMAESFQKKTGISVHVDVDTTILDRIETNLKNGGDYDIYMSHDINWRNYAAQGWLADLDDVYSAQVEGSSKTFEQKLVSGAAANSKFEVNGEEHYYKVCYTQGAGGFVYNIDMFKENNWKVPTTYDELVNLCKTIVDAKLTNDAHKKVVPFAWSGSDRQYYWDYPVFEWWAQKAGLEKISTILEYKGPTGQYADGYEMYNPETYYKEFVEAYKMWWDLVANTPENSTSTARSDNLGKAQMAFANGEAAMIPYAQWAKYELESTNEGKLDFQFAMMKTPKVSASSEDYNYLVGFGDSVVVPSNSPNIDLAKKFLSYMATDQCCHDFVRDAKGAFLAFDYRDIDLSDLEQGDPYVKSIHEKLSENNFALVSKNPITYLTTNKVMPWVNNDYYYAKAASDPSSNQASTVGSKIYEAAKSGWASWCRSAGLA